GIYLYGISNAVIQKNVIHDIGRFAPGENGCNLENHYQNRDHGVYIEASTRVTNKNNLFYNIARGWSIHVYSSRGVRTSDLLIANNIFAFPYPYNYGQVILAAPGVDNASIQNNIFYSPNTAGILIDLDKNPTFSGISITKNLVHAGVIKWPLQATPGITTSSNLENADALLVNPHLYDFSFQPGSPAIDGGAAIAEVAEDIIGRPRPQGQAWDIGAYEYPIISQPQHKIVTASQNAIFTVAPGGAGPFTYQWRKDGVNLVNGGNIFGATSPALTVASTSASDAATYDVIVSEAGGGQFPSAPAQLSVVTQLPVSQQVDPGVTVRFQVIIAGTSPTFSYQWKKDNVQNDLRDGGNTSGTRTPSLQIANVSGSDAGYYRLYVTNKPACWFNALSARLILNQ
ncbi:MAG TPA: immunoglobulin domain-containing protein, partial [Candidatus Binatia bacterium]|nr:immunoglobulin domain-containing protein [Candidatus Binatia bacterium]